VAKKSKDRKRVPAAPVAPKPEVRKGSRNWWIHLVVLLGLFAANVVFYHGTVELGFLSVDDPDYVQNNPYIENFRADNVKHILAQPYAANYAPANLLSYSVDVALAKGKSASAVHLSNVLWHGWVISAVYLLALTIRPNVIMASIAAGLFMLHPAHVEVVAWISSRKDLVATSFAAISMACYLRYRRRENEEGRTVKNTSSKAHLWWYGTSWLSFLVACAGKQSVLLLPIVMFLWDLFVERRRSWQMVVDKAPFGIIVLFFGLMTMRAQPPTRMPHNLFVMASAELTNLWLLSGLGKYVLYRTAPNSSSWGAYARFAIMAIAVLIWFVPLLFLRGRLKKTPDLSAPSSRPPLTSLFPSPISAVLCYWILIQMIPPLVISFLVPITDRYLFLPSVGVCVLVSYALTEIALKFPPARWPLWLLVGALASVWCVKTWNYVEEWRDPRSVWYGAHLKTNNSQVNQFLAEIYHGTAERVNEFIKSGTALQVTNETKIARAVLGDDAPVERMRAEWQGGTSTRTNSAAYRNELWRLAWDQYQESVAHRGTLSAPNLFINRGRLLIGKGEYDKAIPEFQTALRFAQDSTYDIVRQETVIHAMRGIGVAYWSKRDYRAAKDWYLKAQDVQKKSGRAWISTLDDEVARITVLAQ
jgi:hypothetical protein